MVLDYGELSMVKAFLDNNVEHRHLNDVVDFNPTAEHLAGWLFSIFKVWYPKLLSVTVKETSQTEATYSSHYVAVRRSVD